MTLTKIGNIEDTLQQRCDGRAPMDEIRLNIVDVVEIANTIRTLRAKVTDKSQRLRDELAGRALQGMLASHDRGGTGRLWDGCAYADDAYDFADAMLKAREKKE